MKCKLCNVDMYKSSANIIGGTGNSAHDMLICGICGSMYSEREGVFSKNISYIEKLEQGEMFTVITAWRNYMSSNGIDESRATEKDMENFQNKIKTMRTMK